MSEVSESGRAWTTTWLLAVFMLINFLDKIVLGFVAVPMMDELRLTPKQFGDIGSGFFWLFAVGGVLAGTRGRIPSLCPMRICCPIAACSAARSPILSAIGAWL
jgi:hypothetical protein